LLGNTILPFCSGTQHRSTKYIFFLFRIRGIPPNQGYSPSLVLVLWLGWLAFDLRVLSLSSVGHWINTRRGWLSLSSFRGWQNEFQCTGIGAQHQLWSCAPTKWLLPSSQAARRKKKTKKSYSPKLRTPTRPLFTNRLVWNLIQPFHSLVCRIARSSIFRFSIRGASKGMPPNRGYALKCWIPIHPLFTNRLL